MRLKWKRKSFTYPRSQSPTYDKFQNYITNKILQLWASDVQDKNQKQEEDRSYWDTLDYELWIYSFISLQTAKSHLTPYGGRFPE